MSDDLFGEVLTSIADGPRVSEQGGITAALMTRLHEKGMTLEAMGSPKIMARSRRTLEAHARELGLAFDDYTPRALKPRHIVAKKRRLKRDAIAYYDDIAVANPDHLILMRMGDFYEAFGDNAKLLAADLGLVVTKRADRSMCGVPVHAIDGYLKTLAHAGRRVAIVEAK